MTDSAVEQEFAIRLAAQAWLDGQRAYGVEPIWYDQIKVDDPKSLLGQGYSNAGIARALSLSPKTVEGCVSTLFGKLGLLRDDPARNRRVAAALNWVEEAG